MAITKVTTPELIDLPNNQLVTGVSTTYNITVISSGGNKYAVNGTQQANITLIPGTTYTINQDDSTNNAHPLILSTSTVAAGVYSTGVTYSLNGTGVSYASYISGFATATQRRLTITLSSPPTLNYICYYHTGMGGSIITTPGLANTDGVVLPKGTTATRPASAVDGEFRYNTTTKKVEYYDGSSWFTLNSSTAAPQTGTTGACNYPTSATALYQLQSNDDDTCGNYDGTGETAITYTSGKFGNSATFNGTTSKIDLPNSSSLSKANDFSWSFWIYGSSFGADNTILRLTSDYYTSVTVYTDKLMFYSDPTSHQTSAGSVVTGVWQNFVITKSSTTGVVIYKDGTSIYTDSGTTDAGATSAVNRIGAWDGTNYGFPGQIAQVRLFPSALSATQASALATETAP